MEFDPSEENLYVMDFTTYTLSKYPIDANGNPSDAPIEVARLPKPSPNPYNFGSVLTIAFSENGTIYGSVDGTGKLLKIDSKGDMEYIELQDLTVDDSKISNHMITFGRNGFNEESLYITTMEGQKIYECPVGEKRGK